MRKKVETFDLVDTTIKQLGKNGLLLVAGKQGNPMTIGWGTVGIVWGRPAFLVLVRPSRFTFKLMEGTDEFTVGVPTDSLKDEVLICGTKSGRDTDKIHECGFTLAASESVSVPYIRECPIHYECRTIHKNNVINAQLDPEIVGRSYAAGDYHTVYYGQILGVYQESSPALE